MRSGSPHLFTPNSYQYQQYPQYQQYQQSPQFRQYPANISPYSSNPSGLGFPGLVQYPYSPYSLSTSPHAYQPRPSLAPLPENLPASAFSSANAYSSANSYPSANSYSPSYSYSPLLIPQAGFSGEAFSQKGLSIILIAILILVALDLVVVRPQKGH